MSLFGGLNPVAGEEEEEQEGAEIGVGTKGLREEVGFGAEVEGGGRAEEMGREEEEAEAKEVFEEQEA